MKMRLVSLMLVFAHLVTVTPVLARHRHQPAVYGYPGVAAPYGYGGYGYPSAYGAPYAGGYYRGYYDPYGRQYQRERRQRRRTAMIAGAAILGAALLSRNRGSRRHRQYRR